MELVELARYNNRSIGRSEFIYQNVISNGDDNLFSNYLDSLYNSSVTHQGIINDIIRYIMGAGMFTVNPEEQAILDRYLSNKDQRLIVQSKIIQESITIEYARNAFGDIAKLYVYNPSQWRVIQEHNNKPIKFQYRESWIQENYKAYQKTKEVPIAHKNNVNGLFYYYDPGTFPVFYGRPSYISGLNPIELEASIYLMHNHGAQNGMFPSMIIDRVTSGDKDQDRKDSEEIVRQTAGASNGGKVIQTFRPPGADNATNISVPNLTGIDKVYETQYEVAEAGILKAHQVPSVTLISGLNVKPTGLGGAEDEMILALNRWKDKRINPERKQIIEILNPVFEAIGITGGVEFRDQEQQEQIIEENLKSINLSKTDDIDRFIAMGESIEDLKGWTVHSAMDVDYELEEELDEEIKRLNKIFVKTSLRVSTGRARPLQSSEQDGEEGDTQYKIRYRYAGDATGEREFCNRMLAADKLYRKEDIQQMSFSNVNTGLGAGGSNNYSIWLYKGGVYCHHKWERVTFVKKGLEGSIDPRSPIAQRNSLTESQADARGLNPGNDPRVGKRTIDLPNRGSLKFSSIIQKLNDYGNK